MNELKPINEEGSILQEAKAAEPQRPVQTDVSNQQVNNDDFENQVVPNIQNEQEPTTLLTSQSASPVEISAYVDTKLTAVKDSSISRLSPMSYVLSTLFLQVPLFAAISSLYYLTVYLSASGGGFESQGMQLASFSWHTTLMPFGWQVPLYFAAVGLFILSGINVLRYVAIAMLLGGIGYIIYICLNLFSAFSSFISIAFLLPYAGVALFLVFSILMLLRKRVAKYYT